jgi:hypothetical protein
MTDEEKSADRKEQGLTMEEIEQIIPDKRRRDNVLHLLEHLDLDKSAVVVLKGHLVLEEKMTSIIEKFVFHPQHLEKARLTFAQKIAVCRSLSLDEDKNSMWELVGQLNTFRNALSHSLEGESRDRAAAAVRALYIRECENIIDDEESANDAVLMIGAVALCQGFLDAFEQEVERFREHVDRLDKIVNVHRHTDVAAKPVKS